MTQEFRVLYKGILQLFRPNTYTTITPPELPSVKIHIYVSEQGDRASITTELNNNPSSIRISMNSKEALPLDKSIDRYDAEIVLYVFGTMYQKISSSVENEYDKEVFDRFNAFRKCMQFTHEFLPVLKRFILENHSLKVVKQHNKMIAINAID